MIEIDQRNVLVMILQILHKFLHNLSMVTGSHVVGTIATFDGHVIASQFTLLFDVKSQSILFGTFVTELIYCLFSKKFCVRAIIYCVLRRFKQCEYDRRVGTVSTVPNL